MEKAQIKRKFPSRDTSTWPTTGVSFLGTSVLSVPGPSWSQLALGSVMLDFLNLELPRDGEGSGEVA